jgi:hypothetical protein
MQCVIFHDYNVHGLFEMRIAQRNPGRKGASAALDLASAPTEERYRQGTIERLDRLIADETGHPARPYRAVDTLAAMERRGSITPGMRQAAADFRVRFGTAQLDPLRALDYSQPRYGRTGRVNGGGEPGLRVESAREHVWRAIVAVGGPNSPGGSCLWQVVGWECSLKECAFEQGWNGRRVSQEAASGILIAALGALETYYHRQRTLRKSDFAIDKSGSF